MTRAIYYLHGFNSSPGSAKARVLAGWLKCHHPDIRLEIPALGYDPQLAMQHMNALLDSEPAGACIGLIGSSLGGFYATVLSCTRNLPAVLINPAFHPHRLLEDYLGWNENYHTGERYFYTRSHVDQLERMEPAPEALASAAKRLFLITQTGDEVLDYRLALSALPGARTWIQPGGNHGFVAFEQVLPAVVSFLFSSARVFFGKNE